MNRAGRWVAVAFVVVSAAIVTGYVRSQRYTISPQQFSALSQQDRNLAVYDAFARQLRAHYFDRAAIETPKWQKMFADFRAKAAAAPNSVLLYTDVLFQLSEKFPHSHVGTAPPTASSNSSPATALRKENDDRPPTYEPPSFGFDIARVRRGNGYGWIVGDVQAGSAADREGIEPGWVVKSISMNVLKTSCRIKADFHRLTSELAMRVEQGSEVKPPASESAPGQAAVHGFDYPCDPPIHRTPFETRKLANGATYIRFDTFSDTSVVDKVMAAIDGADANGLIIDLRQNSGGRTDLSLFVLGRLLGPDKYVGTLRHGKTDWYAVNVRTKSGARGYAGPLALIIGPLTASAAEIAAAAVTDNGRGRLVGRWSAGAVLNTQEYPLPDGGHCYIPFEDFVRGGERRIEGVGVAPDVWAISTLAEIRTGRDVALEQAALAIEKVVPGTSYRN